MMFWSRLRQSRHKIYAFSNEFKRFYHLNRCPVIANQHISPRTVVPILNIPKFIVQDSQLEFFRNVRFYAKRVKSTPKKKEKEDPVEPRINEQITVPMIRLVMDEGHNVISTREAMAYAKSLKLDLVEVDRQANPPVCKIFDHKKQKYLQQTKEKERAKSKIEPKKGPPKEVRFAAKIKQNDLKIKADMAKRLMDSGYRVKCTATDPTDDVDLKTLLSRFSALIQDVAIEETTPKYEKTQAFIVVRHVKFGPPKKGSGKKASRPGDSSETLEETGETIEVGSEGEHLKKDVQTNKSEWAVFDGDDDGHSIFDINNEENGQSSSTYKQSAAVTGPPPYSLDRKNPRNVVETPPTNTSSFIPSGISKPAMENRYARDPKSAQPPRTPTDMSGRGPNQGNQSRFGMNTSPQMRPKQVEVPGYEVSRQDSFRSSNLNSPPKSYGIFSDQQVNTTPREQNAPASTNRYKINASTDSARSPRTTGLPPQRNSPGADSRMNRGHGVDNPTQGRWGIFSGDNSNVIPNKNGNQAEIQRR